MPDMFFDADLIVIGAGSGGVRAARLAGAAGKKVILIERSRLGGTCVNLGCIPKKLFHYAAQFSQQLHDSRGYGWQGSAQHNWSTLTTAVANEIARLNGIYAQMLKNAGVTIVAGEGKLIGPNAVAVDGQTYTAKHILIAVGSQPRHSTFPGAEWAITSDDFFSLPALPASAVVIGGGYIAVELAGILHGLGCQTTLVYRGDQLLRHFDADIGQHLAGEMQRAGIDIRFHNDVTAIERHVTDVAQHEALAVHLQDGALLKTDCVLQAIGRIPLTTQLGLENTAVQLREGGYIAVAGHGLQTDEPSIYAVGDVVGRKELTPVATAEAMWLVDHLYGDGYRQLPDYALVPTAIFSSPEAASVGLAQHEAETLYGKEDLLVYRSSFRPLKNTVSGNAERTMMKILVQRSTDKVIGMHMVGADAGEILQGFAAAMQCGITKSQLDQTLGIHPTAAEEFVTMRTALS